jgi:predicted nuclease with TOPRIM domain
MPTRIASIAAAILAVILAVISFQASSQKKSLKAELEDTTAELTSTKKDLESTKTKLAETTKAKDNALAAQARAEEELDKTKRELSSVNSKLTSTESELRLAQNEINTLKTQIEQIRPAGGGSVADIAADLQKMRDENTSLQADKARLQEQLESAAKMRAQLEKRIQALTSGINPPGLEGRIIAVDSQWNFITFNLGQNDDIAQNSQVTVVRDGQPIAQVRVTSVENRRSYGDVIRLFGKSLPAVGDAVITN